MKKESLAKLMCIIVNPLYMRLGVVISLMMYGRN